MKDYRFLKDYSSGFMEDGYRPFDYELLQTGVFEGPPKRFLMIYYGQLSQIYERVQLWISGELSRLYFGIYEGV